MRKRDISPEKAAQWERVERAITFLRAEPEVTYAQAAEKFGVGVWQLKRRVIYRHGSLDEMRLAVNDPSPDAPSGFVVR